MIFGRTVRGGIAIFRRDFKKFLSNPFIIVMTLFMPIMYLLVFGNAVGGALTHIPIAVVQEEPYTDLTPQYIASVAGLGSFAQPGYERTFDITAFSNEEKAKQALRRGEVKGVLVFPSPITRDNAIREYVDSSDYATPGLIESGVRQVLQQTGSTNPVQVNQIYGDIKYIQFFGVGVIVLAIFTATMFGSGVALIKDRELGIVEGYLVTPVKRSSIIVGMIGSGTIRAFLAGFTIFIVDILVTGILIRNTQDFLLVLLILFITSVGVTSMMVAISSRFHEQQSYSSVAAFFNLIFFLTSGAFYPTLGMPDWLRGITLINPEYYAVDALRSTILRGQGLGVIWPDIIAMVIFSAIAITLGILSFRRTLE